MKLKNGPIVAALAFLVVACGGGSESQSPTPMGGPAPQLVVERFLQAANTNDLVTMTQLFGTPDKGIVELDGESMAQRRMYVLASLLRHDDFVIQAQRVVPGRMEGATEVLVLLTQGDRQVIVPHLVVKRSGGGWVIERIDVERLTSGSRPQG